MYPAVDRVPEAHLHLTEVPGFSLMMGGHSEVILTNGVVVRILFFDHRIGCRYPPLFPERR